MKRIRSIIVDDEASAVHTLRGMLEEFCSYVTVCAVAGNVEQAIKAVKQHQPDIVFLDVELTPEGNGFDFLRKIGDYNFGVIFTTAYAQYAIEAINEAQPWGFLVKPYRSKELTQAIHVADTHHQKLVSRNKPVNRGFLLGDMRKGNVVIKFKEIYFCRADTSCIIFHLNRNDKTEQFPVYRTLKELEEELPDTYFCRVHHSYLVNLSYIVRYERRGRGGTAYLSNGEKVGISAQKMENFTKQFANFLRGYPPSIDDGV